MPLPDISTFCYGEGLPSYICFFLHSMVSESNAMAWFGWRIHIEVLVQFLNSRAPIFPDSSVETYVEESLFNVILGRKLTNILTIFSRLDISFSSPHQTQTFLK